MNADIQRHPVRGVLWGLLFGVGLYFLALGRKVVAFGTWVPLIILVLVGVALNVVWAMFGPAKRAKAPAPAAAAAAATTVGLPLEPPAMTEAPVTASATTPATTPAEPPAATPVATATPPPAEPPVEAPAPPPDLPPEPGPMS